MNPENTLYRFVKASERLPDDLGSVLLKMSDGYFDATLVKDRDGFLFEVHETHEEFYEASFNGIEWLEEVPEQEQEEVWNRFYEDWSGDKGCCENINDLKQQYILIKKQ